MTKRERTRERARPERGRDRGEARDARREELLDAAVAVIRREGPAVSMEAIAAEAGITKPIVYRHFGDRAGLVHALADRFATALLGELAEVLERPADPRALLHDTIDAYLRFVEAEPHLYGFLVGHAAQAQPERLLGFMRQVSAQVAVVIGERLREAGRDSGAAEPWAHGLVGLVHQAGDWWLERRTMPRARLVEYLVTLLWDGLGSLELPDQTQPAREQAITPLRRKDAR